MNISQLGYNQFMIRNSLLEQGLTDSDIRNALPNTGMLLNPVTDIEFSSTDNDTAAWTAGTIYFADKSETGQIAAGNTGNMTGITYIYYDRNKPGALQTTTSHANATGTSKFIVAIADTGGADKECKIIPAIGAGLVVSDITADQITAGTITTSELNFTPVADDNVIASINASAEGITIEADNIAISGSTTFDSGYDPTSKVASLAGTYNSAESGARVRIFPDSSTGIVVIDDGSNEVFKVEVGGTNVGDVTIGNYSGGAGMLWDKSATTLKIKGNIEAGNIDAARISSGTLSTDRIPNLSAGKITSGYLSADRIESGSITATKLNVTTLSAISANLGTITAGTVSGTTITGGTVQTASSGSRVVLSGADSKMYLYNGGDNLCGTVYGAAGASGSLVLSGAYSVYIKGTAIYLDWLRPDTTSTLYLGNTGDTISMGGNIDLNGNRMDEIGYLSFNTASNSTTNGRMWYYDGGGGNYYLRMYMGSTQQFDTHSP